MKPDNLLVLKMLLKAEGYQGCESLAEHADRFIKKFTHAKNTALYGAKAANSEFIDRVSERTLLRDLRLAVKFAVLLRDQEWQGYRDAVLFRR